MRIDRLSNAKQKNTISVPIEKSLSMKTMSGGAILDIDSGFISKILTYFDVNAFPDEDALSTVDINTAEKIATPNVLPICRNIVNAAVAVPT